MNPRALVPFVHLLALVAVLGNVHPSVAASNSKRPLNVVFILADDLGWADLACYGNRYNETPNLDRLATEGTRFTQFYAAGAVCSPTRASIMTGQYQARHGLTAHIAGHWRPFERLAEPPNALGLPEGVPTVARSLRDAGYATAHFGKWHLGWAGKGTPQDHGFDTAFEWSRHVVPGARLSPPAKEPKRLAEYIADRAVDFMESHRDRPFFLHLSHYAVHIPLETTPELQAKYEAKPRAEDYPSHPLYAGLLEEMDTSVGRVLEALDRLGLRENTVVIFTSDNGGLEREIGGWPGTSNRPLRDEKGSLYEGGIRVPLIVRWPGVTPPGAVSGAVGITTDFFPTLLEAARIKPKGLALDGISLLPALRNPTAPLKREAVYWHYPHYHHSRPAGAIRAADWKAIEFFDTGEVELYNLADDLSESRNLAAQLPRKAAELKSKLALWRREVDAQMPQLNPAHNPQRAQEWWSRGNVAPTDPPGTFRPPAKP